MRRSAARIHDWWPSGAAYSAPPFAVFAYPIVEFAGGLPGCGLDGYGWPDFAAVSVGALAVLVEDHVEIHGFLLGFVFRRGRQPSSS